MNGRRVIEGALLCILAACSPTGYATESPRPCPYPDPELCGGKPGEEGVPPSPEVSPGTEPRDEMHVTEMRNWLEAFRDRQRLYYAENLRYAKDVTVGGQLTVLPSPYETDYQVHQNERNYSITVRHVPALQRCYLSDGETTPGSAVEDAGRIICGRY